MTPSFNPKTRLPYYSYYDPLIHILIQQEKPKHTYKYEMPVTKAAIA